jgi:Fe2+ or Zn2+ uptake regulation protein
MGKATHKLRQSRQRERILQLLKETDTHPSADWLYARLKNEFPKLSLGTVYRNITILIEQGLVQKIHYGSTFDRFEANPEPHYHLICEVCGKIEDFQIPIYEEINQQASANSNFSINRHMIEFFGLCPKCEKA